MSNDLSIKFQNLGKSVYLIFSYSTEWNKKIGDPAAPRAAYGNK
jgi:hypothetical protein